MKVGKQYLGRYVELTWRDPGAARTVLHSYSERPRGVGCLATWRERGVIVDVTDGVVQIEHSHATGAPLLRQEDEVVCTYVPEDLVESITVYEPVSKEGA